LFLHAGPVYVCTINTIKNQDMETTTPTSITVQNTVNAPVEMVWEYWTNPQHITKWNYASDDWHSPRAENDLKVGGIFSARMEAKDGSMGFDFSGVYDIVKKNELIEYTMADGRRCAVKFSGNGNQTNVTETFDAENTHSIELQRGGWQAILDNFKKYVESR
jgi:uncharacterized protein YndB with AHSA1/START domain